MERIALFAGSLAVLLSSASMAQPLAWRSDGPFQWACGGVGSEERRALEALKPQSNLELLFVSGKRAGYLSGVEVSVRAESGTQAPMRILADGPYCYLRAPAGTYRVEARLRDARREQRVRVGAQDLARAVFTFPPDPGDDIPASEEEKRQARQP